MSRDPHKTLKDLVHRATSPTEAGDEEARTAAVKACQLLKQHPELIASPFASGIRAPEKRDDKPAEIHPETARLLAWRRMMSEKRLEETEAYAATLCADCGKGIEVDEPVIRLVNDEIFTHRQCASWWWNFEPPPRRDPQGYDF